MPNSLTKEKIIFKNGRPEAVVLGIKKYERLLEIAENKEDLAELKHIKKNGTSFKQLKEYAKGRI